ncbi:MAG: hypothetical protein ACRDM1_06440 [Gaiellaceae bacterium]
MAYEPLAWHDFFVMLGGASAALAGLVFVGLSIHARAVASDPLHRVRARNLTAGIVSVTIMSALVLTPGQGLTALGVELVIGGAFLGFVFSAPLRLYRTRVDSGLLARTAGAVAASVLTVWAGASLLAHGGGGLYFLVVSGLFGILLNVFGAWTLLVGLARDE